MKRMAAATASAVGAGVDLAALAEDHEAHRRRQRRGDSEHDVDAVVVAARLALRVEVALPIGRLGDRVLAHRARPRRRGKGKQGQGSGQGKEHSLHDDYPTKPVGYLLGYRSFRNRNTTTPVTDTYSQIGSVTRAIRRWVWNRLVRANQAVTSTSGAATAASTVCESSTAK